MTVIVAATGHRPDKLGGYDAGTEKRLVETAVFALTELKPDLVWSGMALGWDLAIAQACVDLDIPFVAAVPFNGQEWKWPPSSQRKYRSLRAEAQRVVIVSEGGYEPWKMQVRNRRMVDECTHVAALWNGTRGGTYNCLEYASQVNRPFRNFWKEFKHG